MLPAIKDDRFDCKDLVPIPMKNAKKCEVLFV